MSLKSIFKLPNKEKKLIYKELFLNLEFDHSVALSGTCKELNKWFKLMDDDVWRFWLYKLEMRILALGRLHVRTYELSSSNSFLNENRSKIEEVKTLLNNLYFGKIYLYVVFNCDEKGNVDKGFLEVSNCCPKALGETLRWSKEKRKCNSYRLIGILGPYYNVNRAYFFMHEVLGYLLHNLVKRIELIILRNDIPKDVMPKNNAESQVFSWIAVSYVFSKLFSVDFIKSEVRIDEFPWVLRRTIDGFNFGQKYIEEILLEYNIDPSQLKRKRKRDIIRYKLEVDDISKYQTSDSESSSDEENIKDVDIKHSSGMKIPQKKMRFE